jgi:imidazolonepropionase-like amidohydrolase
MHVPITISSKTAWRAALLFVSLSFAPAFAATVAFENVRLIVGDGQPPIAGATVVITDERIVQAGPSDRVTIPQAAQRIDAAGKTIMPALIDTHLHVNQPKEALIRDLRRLAYFGVGTAMSLGVDTTDAPFDLRAHPVPGAARLLTAGRGITAPEPGRETAAYWVTSAAEARRAIEENAARRVNIIKIWVDDRRGTVPKLSPALYRSTIEAAHEKGLRVTAHIFALEDAKSLLHAGVDAFAHSVRDREVDLELLRLVRSRPAFVMNPSLPPRGEATDLQWLKGVVADEDFARTQQRNVPRPEQQASFALQARNLRLMKDAGAQIVLGTDTSFDFPNGNTPWAAHVEMEDMVAAGMTPLEVITAGTSGAAAFLELTDVGTVEVGKVADLLVLDGDPAESIRNTRRVSAVYLRGVMVARELYPVN